jgi:hypothetical protein
VSEVELYAAIIEAARVSGLATLWRQQAGNVKVRGGYMHLAPPGAPDLVGWMLRGAKRGCFVGLECKEPKKNPTLIQEAWRREIEKAGGVAACVRSVSEAIEVLTRAAETEAA